MPNFDDVPHPLKSADTMQSTPPRSTSPDEPSKRDRRATRRAYARKQAAGVFAILVLCCLGLTACGGSSGSSSNAAATAASTTSSAGGASTGTTSTGGSSTQGTAAGAGRRRFGAIRECLQKNGVTLPQRTPGSGTPGSGTPGSGAPGGGFPGAGGGPTLPNGVTRAQFEAAMKKCGGGNFGARSGRNGGASFRRVNSPVFKAALTKYATCLRQNGIDIPAPNTSGKGPIFSTKGIDTSSAKFRSATLKCRASLTGAFRRPQGAAGASGSATTPPPSSTTGG